MICWVCEVSINTFEITSVVAHINHQSFVILYQASVIQKIFVAYVTQVNSGVDLLFTVQSSYRNAMFTSLPKCSILFWMHISHIATISGRRILTSSSIMDVGGQPE